MSFVLDASVVVELLAATPDAEVLARRIFGTAATPAASLELHVPHLVDVEVTQVIRRYVARGVMDADRGRAALQILELLPVTRHAHRSMLSRIWALRENLTAYDATYVALAELLDATLLTRDLRLARAPGNQAQIEVV